MLNALILLSALGQCAGGSCAMPAAPSYGYSYSYSYGQAPAYAPPAAAPVYRQYGGSGVIYSFHDPVQLNAWLAVNDPARPAAKPVVEPDGPPIPPPAPPEDEPKTCKCGKDCECCEPFPPFIKPPVPDYSHKHRRHGR